MNGPSKFSSARQIRLVLELLVLACSFFSEGSFFEMLVARKANFY